MSFLPNKLALYIFFSILISLSIFNSYKAITDIIALSRAETEASHEIDRLQEEKSILQKRLEAVNSDVFVEREARTKLNMKREGEEVYIIPTQASDREDGQKVESAEVLGDFTVNQPTPMPSNFDKWLEILF